MLTRMRPDWWPRAWWLLRDGAGDGARNMAVDAALMALAARTGDGFLRVYGWQRRTVSFGRNEAARRHFAPESLERAGFDAVRRPTGGRALLHGSDVTYAVALPLPDSVGWRGAYAEVNARLVEGLQSIGVAATLAVAPGTPLSPDGALCFAAPDAGEVVVAGRKLVGSAVWRESGAYLQHGSILTVDDQQELARAVRPDATAPATLRSEGAVGLSELLGVAPRDTGALAARVAAALAAAFDTAVDAAIDARAPERDGIGESVTPAACDPSFHADVERREAYFRNTSWLWRR